MNVSGVDLADDAAGRFECSLHPSCPDGRVFAREVNPTFARGERLYEADLARSVKRERAALPGIETPALGNSALKRLFQRGKYLTSLI